MLKQQKNAPKKDKKYEKMFFLSNILLYFALEAKHTKFGDTNLITVDFGFEA